MAHKFITLSHAYTVDFSYSKFLVLVKIVKSGGLLLIGVFRTRFMSDWCMSPIRPSVVTML